MIDVKEFSSIIDKKIKKEYIDERSIELLKSYNEKINFFANQVNPYGIKHSAFKETRYLEILKAQMEFIDKNKLPYIVRMNIRPGHIGLIDVVTLKAWDERLIVKFNIKPYSIEMLKVYWEQFLILKEDNKLIANLHLYIHFTYIRFRTLTKRGPRQSSQARFFLSELLRKKGTNFEKVGTFLNVKSSYNWFNSIISDDEFLELYMRDYDNVIKYSFFEDNEIREV